MFGVAPAPAVQPPRKSRNPLRRALWLACGLIALWLVMQFVPRAPAGPDAAPSVAAEIGTADPFDTGTVAGRDLGLREERSLFSPGYVAAVALLVGGAFFALKLRKRGTKAGLPAESLASLGTLTLAQGQTLHLVACGTDVLLVGQSSTGVTLLATYPRAEFEARPRVSPLQLAAEVVTPVEAEAAPPSFAEILRARAPHLFVTGEGRAA